ncbi:MAG: PorT family protein [Bacteroidales bacterium]|nr:PorT family protein [Bacteroidales bacterium]
MHKFYFILVGFIMFSLASFSQSAKIKNLTQYDNQILHFGYTIGVNTGSFHIRFVDNFYSLNEVYGVEIKHHPGIHMGPIMSAKLHNQVDFRTQIILTFIQRDLIYSLAENPLSPNPTLYTHTMKLESSFVEFPISFKFKSERINNYRVFLLGGINSKLDLASQKKINEEDMPKIRLHSFDISAETGMGADFYLDYFKFGVELKFSQGLIDMVNRDETEYSQVFKRLNSQQIMLSFNFGG